ncbi:hypothetical protein HF086_007387 [Spodoptera exigua]|uniref:Protein phosphatase 1 regulatory subunit 35 C-terminal domain-containing protein n=1 Tax=Spodoptera exigua TaxID=7107 RepID=A0A922SH70_SPOEX|nr:hypothetical protein HF086_007387 [Spodoptera exigua]
MHKASSDSKVKKTLVRNCELKVRPSTRRQVVHDVAASSRTSHKSLRSQKENELSQPTLCSSESINNYIADLKNLSPPPLSAEDLNVDKGQLCAKMTKKLNFQFNDRIYKNLVELNANVNNLKSKKTKKPTTNTLRKDLEPNIEDFYEDEKEIDSPPNIPVLKPKFRPIKKVDDGRLHKLVAAFEDL